MEHNPILKNPLSLDSEIPLYSQLVGIIKRSITSGALEEEGFVVRKRGKGTFVTDPNTRRKGVQ